MMTASSLSINTVVQGTITISPNAASGQVTNVGLILGTSNIIDLAARYRVYTTASQVASDFGAAAPEALAATRYFAQTPQPAKLLIGRWAKTAASGQLIGAALSAAQSNIATWQAITSGGVNFTIDGVAKNLTGLNFSGVYNLNGVAAVINTALAGPTCVYNSTFNEFIITSSTTGTSSTVSFATTGTGTDISALLAMTATSSGAYIAQGAAAESALAAVQLFDTAIGQQFYGLFVIGAVDTDHTAIANFIESGANKHAYFINTQEAGVLTASDTTNIAYLLKNQGGLDHSFTQYSSSDLYAVASAMAKAINIDYTGSNTASILMFKQEPGVTPENLNATQLNAALGFNANVYVNYNNGAAIIQPGVQASGKFNDVVLAMDAFYIALSTAAWNALYTNPTKIPQTDQGMDSVANALAAVCEQFRVNGVLAPGVWTNPGFGTLQQNQFLQTGYYVFTPPVASQPASVRATRTSVTFQIAAKLAGGVQDIVFAVTVNQ